MKKILLILILSVSSPLLLMATPDISEGSLPPTDNGDTDDEIPENRHKSQFRQHVYISYDSTTNRATFSLPSGISSVSVIIESASGEVIYGIVDRSNPYLFVNLTSGLCHITCIADTGVTFQGDIEIK